MTNKKQCDILKAMKIENVNVSELKAYAKNAKMHPDEQVQKIASSIEQFGFRQPIVIDKNNVIVMGHGRLLAAKKLGLTEVPCVRADDLTDEQIKALRLIDNKVAKSKTDNSLLAEELSSIFEIDMEQFGFDMDMVVDFNLEDDEDEYEPSSSLQHNVFENQERMQFPSDNYYGIPTLMPTRTTGDKFLRFCDWRECDNPEEYIAHFYYDDYKFMAAWREPDKYLDLLKKFKAVVCPDFSSYTDFPIVLQILGAYRRNWCGAYWQYQGIDVIPDVQWGNEETYKWCFDGIPKNATVAISSVGVTNDPEFNGRVDSLFKRGFDEMIKRLSPSTILWYGDLIDGCQIDNVIHMPSYYATRRQYLNEKQKAKKGRNDG